MNKPSWFQNNITLGNILLGAGMATSFVWGYAQLNAQAAAQARTLSAVELKLRDFDAVLSTMPALSYRVTATEEAVKSTNLRMDTSLQTISARLAEINQSLGGLSTSVAVLAQRLEYAAASSAGAANRRTD